MNEIRFEKKEGLTQQAYKQLKSMILSHQLTPGLVVNESQLQEALGIGRTPVREAILQLSKENLLMIHPRRGIEIARMSPKRIKDIFEIRSILEPQILRIGMGCIDKAWLVDMRNRFMEYSSADFHPSRQETIELSNLDNELHMGIVASIDNAYSNNLMASFQDYLTLFRATTTIDDLRFEPSNKEHIAIISAILENDIEKACSILTEHLTRTYKQAAEVAMNLV